MSNQAQAVIEVDEEKEVDHRGFQSAAARKAAIKKPEPAAGEVLPAEVANDDPAPVVVADLSEQERLVKVRPHRDALNMRVGTKTYSLRAGKEALVPTHVKRHLEEKGII